jgi:hypothetical protein
MAATPSSRAAATKRKHPASPSKLARFLCVSVCEASTKPLPCWFLLDAVLAAHDMKQSQDVGAALAYAVKRGWLRTAGQPVHSLTITVEGAAGFKPSGVRKRRG